MNMTQFTVAGMTCGHCVAAVTEEVSKLESVRTVHVDLTTGAVSVESDAPLSLSSIADAIDEAGYEVTGEVTSR